MCWNLEASATVAAIGLGSTAYAIYRREPLPLTAALAYFSTMELLQAFTYTVVDQCGTPMNEVYSFLGYLHIAFQPFFITAVSLYFISAEARRRAAVPTYVACAFSALIMLMMIYPFSWAGQCTPSSPMCGATFCSYYGSVHIAWDFPINGLMDEVAKYHLAPFGMWTAYIIPAFVLPILYGSWKFTLYHLLMGPIPARLITGSADEMGAFWCLLSIMFLLIVIKTPVRKVLFVDRWVWWRRPDGEQHEPLRVRPVPAE